MDSDEISIAFVDLLFLDHNVPHTRSQIGRKILIMGITVAVILLFFWIVMCGNKWFCFSVKNR